MLNTTSTGIAVDHLDVFLLAQTVLVLWKYMPVLGLRCVVVSHMFSAY